MVLSDLPLIIAPAGISRRERNRRGESSNSREIYFNRKYLHLKYTVSVCQKVRDGYDDVKQKNPEGNALVNFVTFISVTCYQ